MHVWLVEGSRPPLPGPVVYNCVTGPSNPVTWGKLLEAFQTRAQQHPSVRAVWHPSCHFTPSWRWHSVRVATLMVAPAYFFDALIAPLVGRPAT